FRAEAPLGRLRNPTGGAARGARTPRGAEAASAREPGGPGRSIRPGWKTFLIITSPGRSARLARRAGQALLPGVESPIFFPERRAGSGNSRAGRRGEHGEGRTEGGDKLDSGAGIPRRGPQPARPEATASSPQPPFRWAPTAGARVSRPPGPPGPSTHRENSARWFAGRCGPRDPGDRGGRALGPLECGTLTLSPRRGKELATENPSHVRPSHSLPRPGWGLRTVSWTQMGSWGPSSVSCPCPRRLSPLALRPDAVWVPARLEARLPPGEGRPPSPTVAFLKTWQGATTRPGAPEGAQLKTPLESPELPRRSQ
ncbi:translation initiation factor IF-2-like, partial [Trachypithecus francoisi]|uniref:translation initiation factor IF-2-like n=1 Tax=Trachypithecus francoisi TaxID=54180 RepID=UPI00141B2F36